MEHKDRKFLFDVNIFDAPEVEEIAEELPPPPPVFSEEELAAAKDIAFEQGRQKGQKEQVESREQFVAQTLSKIADHFSHLFAAETLRENVFEKEALRLSIAALDVLFPLLNERLGRDEVLRVMEATLHAHRKTKEILIHVPPGLGAEIGALIGRIRANETDEALWRVLEDPHMPPGDCRLEWADGGAVRDSARAARDIRKNMESLLGAPQEPVSEIKPDGIVLEDKANHETPAEGTDER